MTDAAPGPSSPAPLVGAPPRGRLLRKYIALFAAVVCAAVLGNGLVEIWFLYREQTASLTRMQSEQADAAAGKISQFIGEIENQLGWTTQIPWSVGTAEQRRFDARRLLRQVPAITELSQLDATGKERLRVSRLGLDSVDGGADFSTDPKFTEAVAHKVYVGPVYFRNDSEPYMTLAMTGVRRESGVTVAEVNLKFIWDVVSRIKVGRSGQAFVVDATGRLIAHPDIGLVLRNTDLSHFAQVQAAQAAAGRVPGEADRPTVTESIQGKRVISASAPVARLGWRVFAELPLSEAYAPLYASLERTGIIVLIGLAGAFLAGLFLARRMVVPIRALQAGAERIGGGDLGYRVEVRTGDELETLADQFNTMSAELRESKAREERVGRLRRFLTAQLADVIESSGSEALLESHRREVTVVFCDLRGFTAFAEAAEPQEVMRILGEYHAGLGALINKYEGTLERFVGDGLMMLFNDPLPCPDPSLRAVRMAIEMRDCVAALAIGWRQRGHALGFGIGIAHGETTLGRIGFEGRFDYSAIGTVPNLAARLCAEARNGQILIDPKVEGAVAGLVECEVLGELVLKGIRLPVRAVNVLGLRDAAGDAPVRSVASSAAAAARI
ncbi:MAG: transcriptional regulator [Rhodospirillales bacterium]|nr:transcriptional regulator [Rhodospirillales bacterium]